MESTASHGSARRPVHFESEEEELAEYDTLISNPNAITEAPTDRRLKTDDEVEALET